MAKVWAKKVFFTRNVHVFAERNEDLRFSFFASILIEGKCLRKYVHPGTKDGSHSPTSSNIQSVKCSSLSLMYSFFLPHRAFYPRYLYTVLSSNRGKCQGNTYLLGSSSRFLLAFTVHCTVLLFLASIYCTLYVLLFLGSIFTVCIAVSC